MFSNIVSFHCEQKQSFTRFPHGRYRIETKIGEGSYGIVERALDTHTNTLVAIKTMKAFQDNESLPHFVMREFDCLTAFANH